MNFDVSRVGLGTGVSLSQALAALSDTIRRPIVLVIDEAQHAVTTPRGNDALFALKAARDELNSSAHHGLRIVATGSSRAKFALLRASKDQAFYKAAMLSFPPLGRPFIEWFVDNTSLDYRLNVDRTQALFARTGFRPEVLIDALGALQDGRDLDATNIHDEFDRVVQQAHDDDEEATIRTIALLTPLQGAVLRVLVAQGDQYIPYAAATLDAYREELKRMDAQANIDVPNVQAALDALQNKALVWRAAHGEYALEEQGVGELMKARGMGLAGGCWWAGWSVGSDWLRQIPRFVCPADADYATRN